MDGIMLGIEIDNIEIKENKILLKGKKIPNNFSMAFEFSTDIDINKKRDNIIITITCEMFLNKKQQQKCARFKSSFSYNVNQKSTTKRMMPLKNDENDPYIQEEKKIVASAISDSMATMRGIVYAELLDTEIGNAIIPYISYEDSYQKLAFVPNKSTKRKPVRKT